MSRASKQAEITCNDIRDAGYTLGRTLGEGRFSQVLLGTHIKSGEQFAVKVVEASALEGDEEAAEALRIEVEVLKRAARHPNIVALHAVVRTPAATYLVMELLRGGELFDAIIARGSFPEDEARELLRQLLDALAYCHSRGVVHRDLKPENVLFAAEGSEPLLKLIDFGYAAVFRPGEDLLQGLSGTPDYVAPEVLSWYEGDGVEGEPSPSDLRLDYDASCDMWSVGVILYILLCGFPPFYAEGEAELVTRVRSGHFEFIDAYWKGISSSAKDLISRCLSLAPEQRPTPSEALEHPWIANGRRRGGTPVAAPPVAAPPAPAAPPPGKPALQLGAPPARPHAAAAAPPTPAAGELIARIRQMRHSFVPSMQSSSQSMERVPGMQLTLEEDGARFGQAPSREDLQSQGATFVKLPRALFQDLYALCDAQRRGALPDDGEQRLNELLRSLSTEVQQGHLGKPA